MLDWYFWNDLLPANIKVSDYSSPEELLAELVKVQPIDSFSYIGSAEADAQFFGEGKYEGFGFSWRFVAADDARLTRVFSDSPAALGGLERGQRIVALNGRTATEIEAAEGMSAALDETQLDFTMREIDGVTEFTVSIAHDIVTIDPVPQSRLIPVVGAAPIGYLELSTFVSTADLKLDEAFEEFRANDVTDVIIDLRYNGGGLVGTAELFGDYLGGDIAAGLPFSKTLFNADRALAYNTVRLFQQIFDRSVSLSRLIVIATQGTASASELVTNGMAAHVEVAIVGDRTFGKPVGQVGFEFCDKILRPTAFQTVNADDFGDYFGGLPVTAGCAAADDLNVPVGDAADPNMVAALGYLNTGGCPVTSLPGGQSKPEFEQDFSQPDQLGPPWREFAGAY